MLWLGKLYVWKWQKFRPFSNNLLWLFENGRKQTINHLVGILLENGRNFCRFLTTTTSCLKTAENKPSIILWELFWKTAEISAVFQQLGFGCFPTTQNVSVVFQQTGFGRFQTFFFGSFPHTHPKRHYPTLRYPIPTRSRISTSGSIIIFRLFCVPWWYCVVKVVLLLIYVAVMKPLATKKLKR